MIGRADALNAYPFSAPNCAETDRGKLQWNVRENRKIKRSRDFSRDIPSRLFLERIGIFGENEAQIK